MNEVEWCYRIALCGVFSGSFGSIFTHAAVAAAAAVASVAVQVNTLHRTTWREQKQPLLRENTQRTLQQIFMMSNYRNFPFLFPLPFEKCEIVFWFIRWCWVVALVCVYLDIDFSGVLAGFVRMPKKEFVFSRTLRISFGSIRCYYSVRSTKWLMMIANEWIYKFTWCCVHEYAKKHDSSWLRVFVRCVLHDFFGWCALCGVFFIWLVVWLLFVYCTIHIFYSTLQANVLNIAQN